MQQMLNGNPYLTIKLTLKNTNPNPKTKKKWQNDTVTSVDGN